MIHFRHDWKVLSQDALGYFEKQPGENNVLVVPGTVFQCGICSKLIIEPDNLKLQPVEVERII